MTGLKRDTGGAPGPLAQAVAAEVRAALGRKGWRQADLARALEVAEGWVSNRIPVAARVTLDLNDLEAIAEALDVPACSLVPAVVAAPR